MNFKTKTRKHINNDKLFAKLEKYVDLIEEKNQNMNLTGFEGDKLWKEGIYESIVSLEKAFDQHDNTLLDIGAGAGFPSVPYLIVHPNTKLTIYEALEKRIVFLKYVSDTLKLDINLQHVRAETSKSFERFDRITARAVAKFKVLAEISCHLGKVGAHYAFIKGPMAEKELEEAKYICSKIMIEPSIQHLNLIIEKDVNIIKYQKVYSTPKEYPRRWSKIVQ